MIVVLPAFGGDTIMPRCPSDRRDEVDDAAGDLRGSPSSSRRSLESGNSGVRSSNADAAARLVGVMPLMRSTRTSAGYFSLLAGGRVAPFT
jgi:hypothetical protein